MHPEDRPGDAGGPLTSLVFPAYNPGPAAERAWRQAADFLAAAPEAWEVIFVCDGCGDGTPERLAQLTRGHAGRVRVLSHAPNRGKGYAVRRGLLAARGRWRLFADIDLAYGFDDIARVAAALRAGADVAIASRLHPDSRAVLPPGLEGYVYRRRLQSSLFSLLVRLLLPLRQRDTQAGLKGLSARAAGLLLPRLRCRGFGFDCELLTACARLGLPVVEVPVCVRYRDGASTAGLRSVARTVAELWRNPPRLARGRVKCGVTLGGAALLIVTADDFGIGPATTRGILDLASDGLVTCSVLLVTSPHARAAVRAWESAGRTPELGWHPCLTLDWPVLAPATVPSLVGPDGTFRTLGRQTRALLLGRVRAAEVEAELRAQLRRFIDLTGGPPAVVNVHHHLQVFGGVARPLLKVLSGLSPRPYLRRVREPWGLLARVPGARGKRAFLSLLGRRVAARQARLGFPGNDWLAGVTDPRCLGDAKFFTRWLAHVPGRVVELMCHPGHADATLLGRDAEPGDGQMERRPRELRLLRQPSFRDACARAGFTLVSPSALRRLEGLDHAGAA